MFYLGQKVVCIDDTCARSDRIRELERGEIYTVRWKGNYPWPGNPWWDSNLYFLRLDEIVRVPAAELAFAREDVPFGAFRFRPLCERKTDISTLVELLTPAHENA